MSVASLAATAKAWPFEQARELKARIEKLEKAGRPKDAPVIFETGYGPSGLPHIGTFGEVVRTTMVRRAFEALTAAAYKTRLICVSDDMDGMRKIPDTVPNPDKLKDYLQKPLTAVPDPFGAVCLRRCARRSVARWARSARYPVGPPLRITSRVTVDVGRSSRRAISA